MGKQHIQITQHFDAPIETIFNCLTDHETFGQVISTNIKRVMDSHEVQNRLKRKTLPRPLSF